MKRPLLHNIPKHTIRCLLALVLIVVPLVCHGQKPATSIDSLLKELYIVAPHYRDTVQEYRAQMYVRAMLNIDKKNPLFRYLPQILHSEKGISQYLLETYRDIHYTHPGIYDQKLRYINGTLRNHKNIPGVINYFNVNIYEPYLVGDVLLSPLAPKSTRHYHYRLDSITTDSTSRYLYHISFIPKNKSYQLVNGHMIVNDSSWSIRSIYFEGRSDLLRFKCHMYMGKPGTKTEFLPEEYDIEASYALVWNKLSGRYRAHLDYSDIKTEKKKETNYNLTANFSLTCDPTAYKRNEQIFDTLRTIPLESYEQVIYKDYHEREAKRDTLAKKENRRDRFWKYMGNIFLEDYKWTAENLGTFRCTPFINPLLLSYSKSNGLSYRQDFRYSNHFKNAQSLDFRTRLGYNFTRKEFYWQITSNYNYAPMHNGNLEISVGNGNRIYNSDVLEDLKSMADTAINFDFLNLDYFTDLNFQIKNRIELFNGFDLITGVTMHRRTPINLPDFNWEEIFHVREKNNGNEIIGIIRKQYISFAPNIRIEWTPGLYYYISNRRKNRLNSRYPTFILDYERGLNHVFGSTGVYERLEAEIQHTVRLGLRSKLSYRVGGGGFTNQKETYFVDFANLRNNNLPEGWTDDIGGKFQNLDSRWYNASSYYFRFNSVFEAPFMLLRHIGKYTGHIRNERLYLNFLTMRNLPAHVEVGYGIGTFIFDTGVFLSYNPSSKFGIGYKFTFELFN